MMSVQFHLGRYLLRLLNGFVDGSNFISLQFVVYEPVNELLYRVNCDFRSILHDCINASRNINGCQQWYRIFEADEFP